MTDPRCTVDGMTNLDPSEAAQVDAAARAASHVDDLHRPPSGTLYRAKPSAVEAVQWLGDPPSLAACQKFAPGKVAPVYEGRIGAPIGLRLFAGVDGAVGWIPVPVGHWIASNPGDRSDVWPVDPDYFAGKYEAADR